MHHELINALHVSQIECITILWHFALSHVPLREGMQVIIQPIELIRVLYQICRYAKNDVRYAGRVENRD